MAKNGKTVRAIERELEERFASLCLDNKPERMQVARWIAAREEMLARAAPQASLLSANDPAESVPSLTAVDALAEAAAAPFAAKLYRVPVYDVRLVKSRRPLMLASTTAADSKTSASAFQSLIAMTDREHMACLFVNGQHQITGAHVIAVGGQNRIDGVDRRVIFRAAFAACAAAIVLGHNHPSGDPSPSPEDITTTESIMRAAVVVGVPVLDHIIVTRERGRYHSMLDRGILPKVS